METFKPWNDTERCPHCLGGAVVPRERGRPTDVSDVSHVRCTSCGTGWTEADPRVLARVWWSRGAWDGKEAT